MSEKISKNCPEGLKHTIFRHFLDVFCLFGRCVCLVTLSNARPLQLKGVASGMSCDLGRRRAQKISIFRARWFTEWPPPLQFNAFPIEFLWESSSTRLWRILGRTPEGWKKRKDPHPQDKIQHLDFTKDPRPLYYQTPPCAFYHKNVRSKAVFGP